MKAVDSAASPESLSARAQAAADFLRSAGVKDASVAVMLGSGLSDVAGASALPPIPYARIPGFPGTTVEGHPGELRVGPLGAGTALFFCGRIHGYEGWSAREVSFPVRVAAALGAHTLVVTNAAGGIDPAFEPGELVLIADQLNLTGDSPLRGAHEPALGPRFPDMTTAYDAALRREAQASARRVLGAPLREAVYAGVNGPAYETAAEIRMLRVLGAGLVGMSTVHEVIAARHAGLRVFGLSLVANHAAGVTDAPLLHEEVTRAAAQGAGAVARLLEALSGKLLVSPRGGAAA